MDSDEPIDMEYDLSDGVFYGDGQSYDNPFDDTVNDDLDDVDDDLDDGFFGTAFGTW